MYFAVTVARGDEEILVHTAPPERLVLSSRGAGIWRTTLRAIIAWDSTSHCLSLAYVAETRCVILEDCPHQPHIIRCPGSNCSQALRQNSFSCRFSRMLNPHALKRLRGMRHVVIGGSRLC